MSIRRIMSAALVVVLIAAVVLLYKFAPCSTFAAWSPPSFFFAVIWPLLVPVIIGWGAFTVWAGGNLLSWKISGVVWAALVCIIIYGWWSGFLTTYLWWIATPDAPWPRFC